MKFCLCIDTELSVFLIMIVLGTEMKKACHKGLIWLIFSLFAADKFSGKLTSFMVIPHGVADSEVY